MVGIENIHRSGDAIADSHRKPGRLGKKAQIYRLFCWHNVECALVGGRRPDENCKIVSGIEQRTGGESGSSA
jgi:hypothetical protein